MMPSSADGDLGADSQVDSGESMIEINAKQAGLAREFKGAPFGPHGPELQKLLQRMQWGYSRGRTIIVCTKPHAEWRLGRMGPVRGAPMDLSEDQVFDNLGAALWACFRKRWKEMTGQPCPAK
jgi:hypothetical protein